MNADEAILKARAVIIGETELKFLDPTLENYCYPHQADYGPDFQFGPEFPADLGMYLDIAQPQAHKNGDKWIVHFNRVLPAGIMLLPASVLIEIDDITGEASIFRSP